MKRKITLGLCLATLTVAAFPSAGFASPASPTNVKANSPDGTASANVTWSPVSGSLRYRVKAYIGIVAVKTSGVLQANRTTFTFTGLEYGIPYIMKVEAGDASTWSLPTSASPITPQAANPSAPSQPDLTVIADKELKATWNEPAFDGGSVVTTYAVQLMKGTEMIGNPVVTKARNISLLTADKTSSYWVTVTATNAAGKTSAVSEASVSVIPTFQDATRVTVRAPQSPSTRNPTAGSPDQTNNQDSKNNSPITPSNPSASGPSTPNPTNTTPTPTRTIKRGTTTSSKSLVSLSKLSTPKGSKTTFSIATSSRKVCQLKGTSVRNLKAGTCSVKVTVTTKSGKKSSRTVKLIAR